MHYQIQYNLEGVSDVNDYEDTYNDICFLVKSCIAEGYKVTKQIDNLYILEKFERGCKLRRTFKIKEVK